MIVRETRDGIEVLRIEHGKVNAIDLELLEAVSAELESLRREPPAGVVLTGTGRNFSAGLDLVRLLDEDETYVDRLMPALDAALKALYSFPRPVIGAINGHAIAGGFVLACACDHRVVVAEGVKLGITELPVGVPFPAAPLEMVRAAIGTRRAREIAYSGRLFEPAEAAEIGFADQLAPADEVLERAIAVAARWAATPSTAFALTKAQLQRPALEELRRHGQAIDDEVAAVWREPATRAAIRAFIERTLGRG